MLIGGIQKLTLIDYPGRLSCTVFLCNCDFRCPWCYSAELVLPQKIKNLPKILEKDFFKFLRERQGLLEGVVVCGGEPCINQDLPQFCKKIKKLGFLVKLDTNGSRPQMLKDLIDKKLVDYIAMDVKAPPEKYSKICGKRVNIKNIERSIKILKQGKIDYEFRTTVVKDLLKKEDILKIANWISPAKKYFLQNFRPEKTIDSCLKKIKPYPEEYLLQIQKAVSPLFEICQVRL